MMKKPLLFIISLLFLLLVSNLVWSDVGKNNFRFGLQYVNPTGDLRDIELNETWEPDHAIGLSFGYEHVFLNRIGLDINLSYSKHDLVLSGDETSTFGDINHLIPLIAGLNYHFLRNRFVDFYFGPFAGYVFYGKIDLADSNTVTTSIQNDFAFGAVLGLDVSLTGKGFMFSSALKYLQTTAEAGFPGFDELDIDPWVIQLGLGYRF